MSSTSSSTSSSNVQVIAIGASAGGLKALEVFFRNMPPDCGMAFAVAMHLSREHESQLATILQGFTTMPVQRVDTPVEISANHVYVIAPDNHLSVEADRLRVAPRPSKSGVIDHLFHSVAEARQEQAVGIVLSGSGGDGTLGMLAINERGGLLLAQDPQEAEYAAMPNSIIDTGVVDVVLPAAEMPSRLMAMREEATRPVIPHKQSQEEESVMLDILDALQARTGYDFSHYKKNTLLRQIRRRMMVVDAEDMSAYVRFLDQKDEAEALLGNLLISVTQFFRDPNAYEKLESDVLPELFKRASAQKNGNATGVRVWVPACATGEEVYTLGMLLAEQREASGHNVPIQILATDIDESALRIARQRRYTETVSAGLSVERLERFFVKKNGGYEVRDAIRALVVFSSHDLTRDPPFTRIDLLSCRNMLMYFEAGMQQKILKCFAYSLRSGGYLFLGAAEGINRASRYFAPVSRKLGIYRRTSVASPSPPLDFFPLSRSAMSEPASARILSDVIKDSDDSAAEPSPVKPSQQELLLANQEMQSLNEELRSMMEELEVAKEELQSLNEELITVNQELQNKIEEHRRVNNDLHVLIESTNMATLFLDRKLNVMLFTPESTKIYNLLPIDVGRPLEHISHRLTTSEILADARHVIENSEEVSREVQMQDGSWYAMRAMPYRSSERSESGPAEGVVLTFADISLQKKVEKEGDDRFALAFHEGPMAAAFVSRDDGTFIDVNHLFEKITEFSRDDVTGRLASNYGFHVGDDIPVISEQDEDDTQSNLVETRIRTRLGAERDLMVSAIAVDVGGRHCYLTLFYDVTERKRLEREILLVSDREQRRIGIDLHDGLGAHLSGVSLMARGIARNIRNGRAADPDDMDEISQLLGEGIQQARALAQGLNPFLLEVRGLTIALGELVANKEELTGITCEFEGADHDLALSSEQSMHLYRIAQEAVTNAIRHGKAEHIRISLSEKNLRCRLTIQDDGIGFQPGRETGEKSAGMGLSIMRYRADMIGARLKITGSPKRGTTVTCTFRTISNT